MRTEGLGEGYGTQYKWHHHIHPQVKYTYATYAMGSGQEPRLLSLRQTRGIQCATPLGSSAPPTLALRCCRILWAGRLPRTASMRLSTRPPRPGG